MTRFVIYHLFNRFQSIQVEIKKHRLALNSHLKVLILLLRQRLLGHHQSPQALPGHVPTLTSSREGDHVSKHI